MGLFEELKRILDAVDHGADPIEALHGHLCGPKCWHWEALSEERKRQLMRAGAVESAYRRNTRGIIWLSAIRRRSHGVQLSMPSALVARATTSPAP